MKLTLRIDACQINLNAYKRLWYEQQIHQQSMSREINEQPYSRPGSKPVCTLTLIDGFVQCAPNNCNVCYCLCRQYEQVSLFVLINLAAVHCRCSLFDGTVTLQTIAQRVLGLNCQLFKIYIIYICVCVYIICMPNLLWIWQ